jgi:hypothetical protein
MVENSSGAESLWEARSISLDYMLHTYPASMSAFIFILFAFFLRSELRSKKKSVLRIMVFSLATLFSLFGFIKYV